MRPRCDAFTLIESVLALGIVATVLLAVIGLLPAGLEATRSAAQRSAEARIVEQVRVRSLDALPAGDLFFDAAGNPLPGTNSEAAFTARVAAGDGVALPGEAIISLHSIRIRISDRRGSDSFADDWHVHVHQLLLAP